ncbi:hypothetical protein PRZ48_004604 [Zasmidium cellare]|uniref:Major facilitator superfamily (MFS) profile domain-containing protein n=1 Tax=Zasmidium cellare TaxID=395010 RepID=A0ABR0EQ12_ZASCE|nr:hypothetical protein PRZ48_004604 [Zasmidium cellare]
MGYANTLRAETKYSLSTALDMHGSDFSWAVSITFFAVTVLLVPSNLLMKRVSGKYFFPVAILLLGVIVASMSAVKSYGGLLAARFFLGVPEAAIPSACIMYFSFWYKPSERAVRVGLFEASNALATAVGGFISIGVDSLNGKGGMDSWRWLFLIEGIIAIAIAFPLAWLLLTYPETSKALTERERHIAINRFGRGTPRSTDATWDTSSLSQVVARPSTWVFFVSYLCVQIVASSFSTFLPIILNTFNQFPPHKATAYTSIVYFVVIPCYWFWSWHSDYTRERVWHILIPLIASLPCFAVWTYVASNKSYGSISPLVLYGLAFIGHSSSLWNPPMLSYRSATLYGASEQAIGGAITLAGLSIASIIGPQIYSASQKPWYIKGFTTSCVVLAVAIVGYASLPFWLAMEANQRKKATGHTMPSRALEDALHAQVSDQVIANEILQVEGEVKEGGGAVHQEHVPLEVMKGEQRV